MSSTTLVTFDSTIYMAGNINEVKKKFHWVFDVIEEEY